MAEKSKKKSHHWTENIRTLVRPTVTFVVIFAYVYTTVRLTLNLLEAGNVSEALGVFSGLSAVATGIVGFWFGTRGAGGVSAKPASTEQGESASATNSQTVAGDGQTKPNPIALAANAAAGNQAAEQKLKQMFEEAGYK